MSRRDNQRQRSAVAEDDAVTLTMMMVLNDDMRYGFADVINILLDPRSDSAS